MPPFDPHPAWMAVMAVLGGAHVWWVRDRRLRRCALGGWLTLGLVVLWPVGDLAASVSLSVATVQRLVIMLGVAPLFVKSLSTRRLVTLTRPALADALARRLAHPALAMAVVTIVGTLTLSTPIVDEGAHNQWIRVATLIAVVVCGIILWVPALGVMPGARRLSPIARAAYVFVSSLVVTSLSFVWIFARHPLYPALHDQKSLLGMTPLFDQQLAGFVAKIGSYAPMWAVAFTIFARADEAGVGVEESPLHWADVERQLLRVDRARERTTRHARRRGVRPDGE
ncbi:MAG: cytochrome c oxidase assembly protein [Acidobacteriota bacterium]|nr:cytochrome c oxidase assembly protein [Acidobacteriota bacterium]MDE3138330.1 cytochrome c oxidase assembly protein [Acidobacteriota bacterium]MDE3146026.1 cytochrome c oxidase assembly protein [Acidobacteriota bacterium]